ncbi:MAG: PhnD/SsuA/transferrin family substrate-binding protein [Rhodocyclaceae bacterium]|nr:PhnD/SsuA/transferrin family substrate-binding protein [Rhodocyclaceae bacterium]
MPRSAGATVARGTLRIGLTPVFLDDQVSFTARWRRWLEEQLGRPVVFVQRGNYRDVVDLVRGGKIDFAWLCGYPYMRHRREMRLVAVPLWRGQPHYQSYLIADARNTGIRSLAELRGTVFAYSDPDSNSGYLYPQYALTQAGQNPATYFSRTFFTWAHRKVVEAVSIGLSSGGAVDGYVWETLAETAPDLARGTRIIDKSPFLGYPPFVARNDIPEADLRHFRAVLLGMAGNAQGAALLERLRLDGFIPGTPDLYDGIARMADKVRRS